MELNINVVYLLTKREIDVLEEFAKGKDSDEVLQTLNIKEPTLNSHLQRIYAKLGIEGNKGKTLRAVLKYKEEKAKL